MTPTEAFEANLSQHADSYSLRGKFISIVTTQTTPAPLFVLNPSGMGARAAGLLPFFSRFRVKYIRIKFLSPASLSSNVISAVGVLDDLTSVSGDAPTSVAGVAELRCSATAFSAETVPTLFEWRPLDRTRWFYTDTESSGDARFTTPGTVFVASSATNGLTMEIDYSIVFAGASDIAST